MTRIFSSKTLAFLRVTHRDDRMSDGEICARHYLTGESVHLVWRQGIITQIEKADGGPGEDHWIAPALVDLQVNGFGGVDFQQDNLTVEQLLTATRGLQAAGCSRFLPTLVTDQWPKMMARMRWLRALRSQSAELRHAIVGWHVEGPFLSQEPGYHGAHDPALMLSPTPGHIRELREVAGEDPLLITLAPECQGAIPVIAMAVSRGIKVSLGHTCASGEILRQAVEAGATGFTHLGNACPQQLDRHDNILWRALDTSHLKVSLIPDQIHVSASLFRLVHRALDLESIFYVSDAMAGAGAPPGRYSIGALEVEVGADQVARQPGKSNYAGSALRPVDGVLRAARMLGQSWSEVWDRFSAGPAGFMGMSHGLTPGHAADLCLLQTGGNGEPISMRVLIRGEPVGGVLAKWAPAN